MQESERERILAEISELEADLSGCTDSGIANCILWRIEELQKILQDSYKN